MNKKVFIIFFTFFTAIFLIITLIINQTGENYKEVTINGVFIKGDMTKYKVRF